MEPKRPKLLSHFTTDRPVAVLMVFLATVVYGYFSLQRLPVNLMPALTYPTLTVRTEYPGAAPEEVENEVSRPIEEALGVVSGLNKISSISRAGLSDVVLEFLWGTDMSDATQDTLEKLDLVFLPQEAERPLILHFDPALDPIMEFSLSGEGTRFDGEQGLRRLRRLAELQIKRAFEPIKGVAAVRVRGGLEEEIHVLLDEEKLLRRGLSIQSVINRVRQENINVAGGTIQEGRAEYMVRTLNEYENPEQIANTVVTRLEDREIRVKDLGRVEWAHKEREILTKTDGRESVQIDIYKEADANMVAVAKRVIESVGILNLKTNGTRQSQSKPGPKGLASRLHEEEGCKLVLVADRSKFIENSIKEVRNTAILGGLLAVTVLFIFLRNFKTTLIVAVSIPISLLITFAPLNLMGVSLNIMSLGGLALGIGMLVDSSIVVLESIFRCREEGDDLKTAAIRGTAEVRGAVAASTFTSIAVFLPMVFVEGIAGQAFGDLGLAVVISLLASLGVAVFFIPMLASRPALALTTFKENRFAWSQWKAWNDCRDGFRATPGPWLILAAPYFVIRLVLGLVLELTGKLLLVLFLGLTFLISRILLPVIGAIIWLIARGPLRFASYVLDQFNHLYPLTLRWALRNPFSILFLTALTFAVTWLTARTLETELLPEIHQGEFTFEVSLPVGTPLEETHRALEEVEQTILDNSQDIRSLLITFGYDVTNIKRSDEGEHSARFKILVDRGRNVALTENRVMERLRSYFEEIPDLNVRLVRPVLFSAETPVVVEIEGDELSQLKTIAQAAAQKLSLLPQLADVETTLKTGAPEIQVSYHREQLMRFNLNINQTASLVRDMVKGFEPTQFNLKDRRIPILVRLEESDRGYIEDIKRLTINAGGEQPIPLDAIATLEVGEGPSEVRRIDGHRVALVQANLAQGSLGGAVNIIDQRLRDTMEWPPGMSFRITGQNEEWERSRGSLYLALGLSIFLVYVIMAAQFESLLQPFIIMFSIPLAFFGSVLGLKFLGISLSIVVFLGMIMLVGIVVNNAIVLIDYTNTLKRRGLPRDEAVITASSVRLRPILMTTATTVLGLAPMAMGLGDGAEIRTPMAITVICGLLTSSILTLGVIPTLYSLLDRLKDRIIHQPATSVETD